jgi:cell division protein FtsL
MKFLRVWIPLWVIPIVAGLAIGATWMRLGIVRTTYAINQAEREVRNLQIEREQMQLKVTALRSPRRLEALARARFGLSQPKSDRIVQMNPLPVKALASSAW